jgi:Icc-related predicted phosphoesterase
VAIYVVSDLHGSASALADAVPRGATLLLLGDLINFIDYRSMSGILVDVFSVEAVAEVVELRTAGRVEEAREVMRARSKGREDEVRSEIGRRVLSQYEEVFEALPHPTYLILGNVDNPAIAREFVDRTEGVEDVDGRVIELEGERFGFAGGALPTPLRVAGEVTAEELRGKLDSLGEVDVLCTHIPPAIPELCFDTVARKSEQGSRDILEYLQDVQPRRHYFGHLHQPLLSTYRLGRTLCVNVGYFRRTKQAFPHL